MDENLKLRAELDELRKAVLEDWIFVTTCNRDATRAMQRTVSWRVIRTLRSLNPALRKASEIGYLRAGQLVAARLAKKLGRD